ncbi:MAG: hypothetical protein CMM52_07025 [Rhodospirillaceae bacterium]|nr:hypothetical protein [Rhodospirillaceae bacterium]|tara:strand:- start:58736 stop:62461 length:3726 start_codon:yes stop_codon:yes gene_type:complete
MRKILIGIGVFVVLIIGAAIVVPGFIDWNRYKGEIQSQVKQVTGRNLVIADDISLTILPEPRLSVKNVRFANIKGGSSRDMVKLAALDIRVRALPLLQGQIEVASINLINPTILLERLPDKRVNWDFSQSKKENRKTSVHGAPNRVGGSTPDVQLDNLLLQNGTVVWRDGVAGTEERLTNVSLQLGARSLNGPFNLRGEALHRGVKAAIETAIGELRPTTAAPVSVIITLPNAGAKAQISGSLVAVGAPPRFTGKVNLSGKDLFKTLKAFVGDASALGNLKQPYLLRANVKGTEKAVSLSAIDIEAGGTRGAGKFDITLGKKPKLSGKLAVTRVDLDSLLAAKSKANSESAAKGVASGRPKSRNSQSKQKSNNKGKSRKAKRDQSGFTLPDLDGSFDLTVDAITYHKRNIRGVELSALLAKNTLQLTRARILLPGGGETNLTGVLGAFQGRPSYRANLDVKSDNLRSFLTWLGIDATSVPPDRLRKFSMSTALRGDDQSVQVSSVKARLDATQIDGAVTLALRKRLAFGASVSIDKFDIDAYRTSEVAQKRAGKQTTRKSTKSQRVRRKGTAKNSGNTRQELPKPLAVLTGFDANLNMRVGRLTVNKTPVRDLRFEGTLSGGSLKIKNAFVRDVGGMRATIKGELGNLAGFPTFKGTISADASDIGGSLRLLGVTPSPAAKKLGALRLRGKADASADKVKLDLSMNAVGATTSLKGTVSGVQRNPELNLTLSSQHKNFSQFLRKLGGGAVAQNLGPFRMDLRAKGGLKKIAADLRLKAAGGSLSANGTASQILVAPVFALNVAASHPSVRQLVRHFVPDYRPAGGSIGRFTLSAALSGGKQNYGLKNLLVNAGDLKLKGNGKLNTGSARPKLTAEFTAGQINLNPFLPPKARKSAQSSRNRSSRRVAPGSRKNTSRAKQRSTTKPSPYSTKRIDTEPLGLVDVDVAINAKNLLFRQFRVDDPVIKATLTNKLLAIKEVAGKMFDGSFLLNGQFNGRQTPKLSGRVRVSKANVGKALFQTGTFDIKGGITDIDVNVSTAGISQLAMVRALKGSGKLSSRDGFVTGFDLKAISDRLKNIHGVIDLLTLFGSAMSGGQSRFSALDATFKIDKGNVRTNDVLLKAEAAEGRAQGFTNLPNWHMDFRSQFRLTEHPNAPAFKMRAVGEVDNPRRFFDFKDLQSYLLQRGIGSLIRKVFPGSRSPQPGSQPGTSQQQKPPLQKQEQPKKPRLEDIIPGVLDQLLKSR